MVVGKGSRDVMGVLLSESMQKAEEDAANQVRGQERTTSSSAGRGNLPGKETE